MPIWEHSPNLGRLAGLHCILTELGGSSSLAWGKGTKPPCPMVSRRWPNRAAWICTHKIARISLTWGGGFGCCLMAASRPRPTCWNTLFPAHSIPLPSPRLEKPLRWPNSVSAGVAFCRCAWVYTSACINPASFLLMPTCFTARLQQTWADASTCICPTGTLGCSFSLMKSLSVSLIPTIDHIILALISTIVSAIA